MVAWERWGREEFAMDQTISGEDRGIIFAIAPNLITEIR
jgi:hypothetical protein